MGKLRVAAVTLGAALLAVSLVVTGQSQKLQSTKAAPWTFRADWSGGYSGWMSFPLAQDVGYDPSIYTESQDDRTVLVHKFVAHGETQPWFGLVRPLKFSAGPGTSIEIQYHLKLTGVLSNPQLLLAAEDGHLYSAPLPAGTGEHTVHINAAAMKLNAPTSIQAIILRGRLQQPPTGSESQWILERFVLHATRQREVELSLPHATEAIDGSWVARQAIARHLPQRLRRIRRRRRARRSPIASVSPACRTRSRPLPSASCCMTRIRRIRRASSMMARWSGASSR